MWPPRAGGPGWTPGGWTCDGRACTRRRGWRAGCAASPPATTSTPNAPSCSPSDRINPPTGCWNVGAGPPRVMTGCGPASCGEICRQAALLRLAGEGGGAVRRAEPGRAVVADLGVAPERVRRAGTVGADGDVVQRARVRVRVGVGERAGRWRAGQREDRRDDRRGRAGAADLEPAALGVGVVDGHAGVRVGDRGHVVVDPVAAALVGLEGRPALELRAARAGALAAEAAAPRGLGPPAGVDAPNQACAADRGDPSRGGRVGNAI